MRKPKTKPKAKAFQTRTANPKISAGMRRYWQDRRKRESVAQVRPHILLDMLRDIRIQLVDTQRFAAKLERLAAKLNKEM